MTRIIKEYTNKFTVISNNEVQDKRLSWKARGIFSYLWSMPDNWDFYETEVAKHAPDGRDSLRSGLMELEEHGYLKRERVRNKGQFGGTAWIITDNPTPKTENQTPMLENPTQGSPMLENPTQENPTLQNKYHTKDLPNKGLTNKQANASSADADLSVSFNKLWNLYPKKQGKKDAFRHYKAWRKKSKDNTDDYLLRKLNEYKAYLSANQWLHPMNGSTWFNGRFDDDYSTNNGQSYQQPRQPQKDGGFVQKLVDGKWTQSEINTAINGTSGLSPQQKAYYTQPVDQEGNTQYRIDYLAGTAIPISDALDQL
ncbi:hypothetical protein [Limosilactobacillus mucosae]|uniref:hypothetical protein n=1 Tax=Limosilactobacillus mucosae TaxID=97478 RepID=UPI000FFC2042|nr:hypothetical protein [Limosilactobacillus mucosae]RXA58169.1 hypothetical protein EQ839_02975 [Limosilactobacillus mucosae]